MLYASTMHSNITHKGKNTIWNTAKQKRQENLSYYEKIRKEVERIYLLKIVLFLTQLCLPEWWIQVVLIAFGGEAAPSAASNVAAAARATASAVTESARAHSHYSS